MNHPTTSEVTMEKPSLLIVDDEPSILSALRVVFRSGYNVTATTDGLEAVELMKTRKFDVIISDQRMPKMTGVQLLRHAFELAPNAVRLLLTGYSDTDAILGAINDVEVHRFLQKPWDNTKLKQTVDEAIQLAKSLSAASSNQITATPPVSAVSLARTTPNVISVPVRHHEHLHVGDDAARETVLVVDAMKTLHTEVRAKIAGMADVAHARGVMDVFRILESHPVSIIVCAFDVQNEADRIFLRMLKQEYPYIFVIAVCDSTDSTGLIELINQARIFRFVKKPININLLVRYIATAVEQVTAMKKNPTLIRKQRAEAMPEALMKSAPAQALRGHFDSVNKSLLPSLAKLLGFFHLA